MSFSALKSKQSEYNILLIGETGVGKSLLVNVFDNFVLYQSLDEAQKQGVRCLIPTTFSISDEDYNMHPISVGNDDNERMDIAQSGTVSCKSYVFTLPDFKIRLIDSAGIADTQGRQVDTRNIEDILEFINHFDALHAIAIVANSNQTRITEQFQYCFSKLMSNLDKSAISNIVFLLTASESSGYTPGNVMMPLKSYLSGLKQEQLQLSKDTVYCFDNNWFRYLLAGQHGVRFKDEDWQHYSKSWSRSFDEYARLLRYVIGDQDHPGLIPHNVKASTTNEARLFIIKLNPIIQEILKNIFANLFMLDMTLFLCSQMDEEINVWELDKTMEFHDIEMIPLQQPQLECVSSKCRMEAKKGDEETFIYPKVCCDGCSIRLGRRLLCQQIELLSGNCKVCGCHEDNHRRVNVKAKQIKREIANPVVVENIKNATFVKEVLDQLVEYIMNNLEKYRDESKLIKTAMSRFAKFIEQNSIAPPPDDDVLRGASNSSNQTSSTAVASAPPDVVSKEEVLDYKGKLLLLEIHGKKIQTAVEMIESAEQNELQEREIIVTHVNGACHGIAKKFGY